MNDYDNRRSDICISLKSTTVSVDLSIHLFICLLIYLSNNLYRFIEAENIVKECILKYIINNEIFEIYHFSYHFLQIKSKLTLWITIC